MICVNIISKRTLKSALPTDGAKEINSTDLPALRASMTGLKKHGEKGG